MTIRPGRAFGAAGANLAASKFTFATVALKVFNQAQRPFKKKTKMPGGPARELIARALDIAERRLGVFDLSLHVDAPLLLIRAWRAGHATMPQEKFAKLVRILNKLHPTWRDEVLPFG